MPPSWTDAGRWAGLAEPAGLEDPEDCLSLAFELGLEGLAVSWLQRRADLAVSSAVLRARRQLESWRRANMVRLAIASDLAMLLGAEGIRCVPIKGVALVCREYADPGLRPMADVDVLVPRDAFRQALALISGCGWTATSPPRRVGSGSYQVRLVTGGGAAVEVHHAFEAPELFPVDYPGILGRSVVARAAPGILLMDPVDSLLGLALHHAKHGWILQARDILDVALVARGVRDWAEVWSRARQWNLEIALIMSLVLARRLGGAIPPPDQHPLDRLLSSVLSPDPPFSPLRAFPRTAHAAAMLASAGPRRFAAFGTRFVWARLLSG